MRHGALDVLAVSEGPQDAIETSRLVPSVTVALKLGVALDLSVETLFGDTPSPAGMMLESNANVPVAVEPASGPLIAVTSNS